MASPDPGPGSAERAETAPTWFDKRVEALVALVTGQNTGSYRAGRHKRAIELYHRYEDASRGSSETWVIALRSLMIEDGVLSEREIDEKLAAVRRSLTKRRT